MITIIDYGLGNLGSIENMLRKIGVDCIVSSDGSDIEKASKIILPGVGSFDRGMENLKNLGFLPILNKKVLKEKKLVLGVCLGMQLFASKSEEGKKSGLGWIEGEVKKFNLSGNKIPHMGWNNIEIKKEDPLLSGIDGKARFYFIHSYHFVCLEENILAGTDYGYSFASVIRKENIFGVQFHPEKSHKFGMKLLSNFAKLC